MVNIRRPLDLGSLTRLGGWMVRLGSVEYAASWDGFSFVDALTGIKCLVSAEYVATFGYETITDQESLVECGICDDSTKGMDHG